MLFSSSYEGCLNEKHYKNIQNTNHINVKFSSPSDKIKLPQCQTKTKQKQEFGANLLHFQNKLNIKEKHLTRRTVSSLEKHA